MPPTVRMIADRDIDPYNPDAPRGQFRKIYKGEVFDALAEHVTLFETVGSAHREPVIGEMVAADRITDTGSDADDANTMEAKVMTMDNTSPLMPHSQQKGKYTRRDMKAKP